MRHILIGFILGGILVGGASYVLAQNPALDHYRQMQLQQELETRQYEPGGRYYGGGSYQTPSRPLPKSPC